MRNTELTGVRRGDVVNGGNEGETQRPYKVWSKKQVYDARDKVQILAHRGNVT